MSRSTKQTKTTSAQVSKAVEEPKVVEQVKVVETKQVKQTKVEEPKVVAKVEEHEEHEEEEVERKQKVLEFSSASEAYDEITRLTETIAVSSKRLGQVEKVYSKLLSKEMKQSRNRKQNSDKSKAGSKSGFNKPQAIPEHIRNFINTSCREEFRVAADDLKPRTWITKAIYSYIHDNKLTAENNGRQIVTNDVLLDLFDIKDSQQEVTFKNFQKMVSRAFNKGKESGDDEASGDEETSGEEVVEVKPTKSTGKVATK